MTKRKAPAAKAADPIFAMIAEHKRLEKEWLRLSNELDLAEAEARKKYGAQPLDLIEWRNYSAIGEYGIDKAREEFLSLPGADRDKVEAEYQDAKRRFAARGYECIAWDYRTGVAFLREQYECAKIAMERAPIRMARTKQTTPAGAAALISQVRRELMTGEVGWETTALRMIAVSLAQMEAA